MKKIILTIFLISVFSSSVFADEYVNGYYRKNGTYVQPYYKSSPNNYAYDNYSTKGNVNPYTGQAGYTTPKPIYNSYSNNNNYNSSYGYKTQNYGSWNN